MDNDHKILTMVGDMADTLQAVAVNKYHTPYLYSVFLRALLAAKLEGSRPGSPRLMATPGPIISANDPTMQTSGLHFAPGPDSPTRNGFANSGDMFGLDMYRSLGENYGETSNFVNPFDMPTSNQQMNMDISSSFNPSAPTPNADPYAPLSLDSLLSSGFWDSMLVPGEFLSQTLFWELCSIVYRFLQYPRGNERWIYLRTRRQWIHLAMAFTFQLSPPNAKGGQPVAAWNDATGSQLDDVLFMPFAGQGFQSLLLLVAPPQSAFDGQ